MASDLIRMQFQEQLVSLRLAVASAEAELASALDVIELRIKHLLSEI